MDHFEGKYIYQLKEGKSLTYFRYFDAIFLIWTRRQNELDQFFEDLNKRHPSIKLDYRTWKITLCF